MITSPSRRPNRGARRALALVAAGLAHVAGPARPGWRRALPRRRRRRKRAPTAQTVRGGAQERAGPCRAWGRRADGGACPRCRPWILRVAGGGGAADGGIYMGGRRCGSGRGILQSRGNRPQRAPAVVGSGGVQVRTQGWRLARPWRGGGGGGGPAAALRFFFSLFLHRFLRVFYLLFFPPLSLFFSSLLMFVQIKL
jgi:hypothetical protein